jgi:hypothetical protein
MHKLGLQAARALTTVREESRFEALTARTSTRFAAIIGLTLAHRVMGEPRCLEIANVLGPYVTEGSSGFCVKRPI